MNEKVKRTAAFLRASLGQLDFYLTEKSKVSSFKKGEFTHVVLVPLKDSSYTMQRGNYVGLWVAGEFGHNLHDVVGHANHFIRRTREAEKVYIFDAAFILGDLNDN